MSIRRNTPRTRPHNLRVLAVALGFGLILPLVGCSSSPKGPTEAELRAADARILQQLQAEFRPRASIQPQLLALQRSTHEPVDAIEQAMLDGQYDQVIEAVDQAQADDQLDFARAYQRAEATRQRFLAFVYDEVIGVKCGLEDNRRKLQLKSQLVTRAYESAFALAPDDNARLRVAGQWQWTMVTPYFFDDSQVLRAALPDYQGEYTHITDPPRQTTVRYRELRDVIHDCLSTRKEFVGWQPGEIDHAATLLANEYHKLAHLPVAPERFEQIVKGVPDVLVYAMNLRRSDAHKRDQQLIPDYCPRTFRWHLWCGMTSELPSPAMRAKLDRQVGEALARWHAMYQTLTLHRTLPLTADDIVGWGLDDYERFKDNPLVPYYKRPYRADQWAGIKHELVDQSDGIHRFYPRGNTRVSEAMTTRSTRWQQDIYENELRDARNTQLHFSSSASTRIIDKLRQPSTYDRSPMPDARASSWGGSGSNEHGVYLMSIGKTVPIPAYPWKKYDQH